MATRASTLAWEIPGQRSLAGCSLWSHKEQDTSERSTAGVSELCEPPPTSAVGSVSVTVV